MKSILFIISSIRLIPHFIFLKIKCDNKIINRDIERWMKLMNRIKSINYSFFYLMTFVPEFRNLYYYRLGKLSNLINWICPKMNTLFIATKDIGSGLFLQHGFSTIIAAKSIGKNCWINQQVTIGYSNETDCPIIMDNVIIHAGAKVIGDVIIGNNCIVGANAVVVKNVPPNCVVVGVPAIIVKKNGQKVNIKL